MRLRKERLGDLGLKANTIPRGAHIDLEYEYGKFKARKGSDEE